jgi:hypothetical protein
VIVGLARQDFERRQKWLAEKHKSWDERFQYGFLPLHVYGAASPAEIIRRAIVGRYAVIYGSSLKQRIALYSNEEALRQAHAMAEING